MMNKIILIICLCVGVLVVGAICLLTKYLLHRIRTKISFKDSLDKSSLAIIPLENNGKTLNFIIDSGSTCNVLDVSSLDGLSVMYEKINPSDVESVSISGSAETVGVVSMMLQNNKEKFFETFYVMDISDSLKWGEEEYGDKIHGLLGMDFLTHYSKVLDFDNCIIYSK